MVNVFDKFILLSFDEKCSRPSPKKFTIAEEYNKANGKMKKVNG